MSSNSTGSSNVAFGYSALVNNTTASNNTAVGYQAGYTNITGVRQSFFGSQAGYYMTDENTAVGYRALYGASGSSGYYNVAVGRYALNVITSGVNNVAIGDQTLQANTTASNNTVIGHQAGINITTGSSNTFVGYNAGCNNGSQAQNVCIGYAAGNSNGGSGNVCIGYNAVGSGAGGTEVMMGNANGSAWAGKGGNTAYINGNGGGTYQGNNSAAWSVTSDQRLKKNIVDNTEGLDIISQIRVRNFEYRTVDEVTELPAHSVINKQGIQLGVIAQELQAVCPDCVKEETTGVLSVDSENLTWHMINAIKDLKAELDTVKAELAALKG
jgi:hypothetical protein